MIRVTSLDENAAASDNLLADYLLDCSNISKDEKRLIQTVCLNMSDLEMIATALRKQKQEQARGGQEQSFLDFHIEGHASSAVDLGEEKRTLTMTARKKNEFESVEVCAYTTSCSRSTRANTPKTWVYRWTRTFAHSVRRESCRSKNDGGRDSKQTRGHPAGAAVWAGDDKCPTRKGGSKGKGKSGSGGKSGKGSQNFRRRPIARPTQLCYG